MKSSKKPENNFFNVNHKIFNHPLWQAEKFTKGRGWIDLFGHANHSPGYVIIRGQKITLERGQTARSILNLSKTWRWNKKTVSRFLDFLEDEQMIIQRRDNKTTIITICNYDRYQSKEPCEGTPEREAERCPVSRAAGVPFRGPQVSRNRDTKNIHRSFRNN